MKPPSRNILDASGISRTPDHKLQWARAIAAGVFVFVYSMTFAITDAPRWQSWMVLGAAVLSLLAFWVVAIRVGRGEKRAAHDAESHGRASIDDDRNEREATPVLKFDGAAALFVVVAGLVILLIAAGSQWWGFPVSWAVVATGLFVPASLFFVYQRWSGAKRGGASHLGAPTA